MIKESPTPAIKQDPEVIQEEQDDLILSYLNSDYVSTETTTDDPPSPPYSTSSASTDAAPSMDIDMTLDQSSPPLYMQDPFLFHLQTALNEQGMPLPWPASTAALPTAPFPGGGVDTQDPSCLMNIHPLFMPSTNQPPFLSQTPLYQQYLQPRDAPRSSSCSSSDSEQSKKKRGGRKKREVSIAPAPLKPLTRILPAAETSPPPQPKDDDHVVKQETSVAASLDQLPPPPQRTDKTPAELAYAKRQERLIKNRAAALLSRKRKREHLTTLEDERQQLMNENETLHSKVSSLEARVVSLEQENMELKRKLAPSLGKQHHYHHPSIATPKHAKTTGMVFMIILFSFALFTLPSSHSADQLTVGGGSTKPNIALIGSSPSSVPEIRLDIASTTTNEAPSTLNTTTDLMLSDHVRPGDLQTWIKEKLGDQRQQQQQQQHELVQWRDRQDTSKSASHLYLYADEFSHVTPLHQHTPPTDEPTLSILCPLNQTEKCERPTYLQIDVKVLGSRVLEGELKHIQQQDHAWTPTHDHVDNDAVMFDLKGDPVNSNMDDDTTESSAFDRRRQLRKKAIMNGAASRISRVVLG